MNEPVITKFGTIHEDEKGGLVFSNFRTDGNDLGLSMEVALLIAIKNRITEALQEQIELEKAN